MTDWRGMRMLLPSMNFVLLLGLSWWQAQPPLVDIPGGSVEVVMLQLVKEGGAWAILALTLWFYRRDWVRLTDQTKPLMDLAAGVIGAQKEVVAQLELNAEVTRQILVHLDTITLQQARLTAHVTPPLLPTLTARPAAPKRRR